MAQLFEIRGSTKDFERVFINLYEQEEIMAKAEKVNANTFLRAADYYADTSFDLKDLDSR